jgi:hypothetical protein
MRRANTKIPVSYVRDLTVHAVILAGPILLEFNGILTAGLLVLFKNLRTFTKALVWVINVQTCCNLWGLSGLWRVYCTVHGKKPLRPVTFNMKTVEEYT